MLPDDVVDELLEDLEPVTFSLGETIVEEGEPGACAYLIYSGRVRVFRQLGGRPVTLATLASGDVFGEVSIVRDQPRIASVRASEDVVLLRIDRQDLDALLARHPQLKPYFDRIVEETRAQHLPSHDHVHGAIAGAAGEHVAGSVRTM